MEGCLGHIHAYYFSYANWLKNYTLLRNSLIFILKELNLSCSSPL